MSFSNCPEYSAVKFNPLKISFTNIFATRLGVPFKLSSERSSPRTSIISAKECSILSIFSVSVKSKARACIGVFIMVSFKSVFDSSCISFFVPLFFYLSNSSNRSTGRAITALPSFTTIGLSMSMGFCDKISNHCSSVKCCPIYFS